MSLKHPGSKHHKAMNSARWARTRKEVFLRDGYRCRKCGKSGCLEAHHSPPLSAGVVDPYALDGIVTLCRSCHFEHHKPAVDPAITAWTDFLKSSFKHS